MNRPTQQSKFSMTNCAKTGIKIKNNGNDYTSNPFADVDPFKNTKKEIDAVNVSYGKTQYESLDLNIENYSREELYNLFGFKTSIDLTEEIMKEAKKIVLKTHPDKSRLDDKYFIFFGKAYKKLTDIYEFHNKTNKKPSNYDTFVDEPNNKILDKMFTLKKDLKEPANFNEWFNSQFDKHKLDDPVENGYGNWLKSDEDIIFTPQNMNKDSIGKEMDKRKKEIQSITTYKGVGDAFSRSSAGGASLMNYDSNFSSNSLFGGDNRVGYTDLKQAYVESVIPVTEDDYNKIQKFKSVDEYKRHRENTSMVYCSKEESLRQLYDIEKQSNEESAALAFYYAQQTEKSKKNSENFWSGLKQITN